VTLTRQPTHNPLRNKVQRDAADFNRRIAALIRTAEDNGWAGVRADLQRAQARIRPLLHPDDAKGLV
jgi:hypothetical protein